MSPFFAASLSVIGISCLGGLIFQQPMTGLLVGLACVIAILLWAGDE